MINVFEQFTNNQDQIHFLAKMLLILAGIPPYEDAIEGDQYSISEFLIDVHEIVIVNNGKRHSLSVTRRQ